MAVRLPGVWGIDLGQCALKAIRLDEKDGEVIATAFEYIEHAKILSQPDADPDELSREALNQFLSRNSIKGDFIAISVPGQSGLARFVKLPPVDEKKIADIVKFEAKQQIPFPLEEVVWDFQRLNRGDIVDGLALETEIGLFAMKRDMVTRAIAQFKEVNVEVHLVQMAPLALCNLISYDLLGKGTDDAAEDEEGNQCIVGLEIGTDSSNLVITNGGRIIWQRPIPIGGNHFTRALTKEMKLTFAKAEHLKKNAAKSPDLKKILSSLKQVLNDFVGEVQRSLGYFTNTHRNAQILYMVGLGNAFRLPGLQKFLQEKLQLEVRKLKQLERSTGETVTAAPTFSENIMSFGVAYGLALQGLKKARLQTNLLPYEVRMERVIRGKKPWAVTAAAVLVAGLSMLAFARGMEQSAIVNKEVERETKALRDVADLAQKRDAAFKKEQERLDSTVKALDRIGAGVNERINWQLLHQYVNMSSPQPNGGRLAEETRDTQFKARQQYWANNALAQDAFDKFEKKKLGIIKDLPAEEANKMDALIKKNLIQINIVGINALYTEDLGPFFNKIYQDGDKLFGMTAREKRDVEEYFNAKNDAEKAKTAKLFTEGLLTGGTDGWVVEVRGYTYHKEGDLFVVNTIMENLRYPFTENAELKEMSARIKERVGYLHLYKKENVENPVAGEFKLIGKTFVKSLIKGADEQKGAGKGGGSLNIGGDPGKGQGEDKAEKVNRDGWKPIGEMATIIFADGAGGGAGQGAGAGAGAGGVGPGANKLGAFDPGKKNDPEVKGAPQAAVVPRTEFVLLFIWREPALAPAVDEKKN